jgi:predicted phosphodiesterase
MRFPFFYKLSVIIYFQLHILTAQNNSETHKLSGDSKLTSTLISVPDDALSFLVIGDWGRCGELNQNEVAKQLAFFSEESKASFIISTGDNFYPDGVASINDPLWDKSFENVYTQYSLQKNWYVVLGNHDYKTNPQAEIDYSKKSVRWKMPYNYYSFKIPISIDTSVKALFVFIDSSPFIEKYYQEKDYEKLVSQQDTAAQKKWLRSVLSDPDPTIKWKFVIGHHPLYSSGKRINNAETIQYRKLMEKTFSNYNVDAYFCGHEHHLEYVKTNDQIHHFISGAGSEVREVKGNLEESVFKISDAGFMLFSVAASELLVQIINREGKILFKQSLKK